VKNGKDLLLVLLLTGVFLACPMVLNEQASAQDREEGKSLPVTIVSDRMEGSLEAGVITFMEGVKVVRGDMVLHADKVDIFPGDGGESIDRIVATGHVRVISGSRASVSDRVEYLEETAVLIMTGHAKVQDGNNTITGPLIRVYLDEDRAEVEGNTVERPKFFFLPETLKKEGGP
jgi:lipopolysaccharide transport protein LptA